MGVKRYRTNAGYRFKVDERIKLRDGKEKRLRMQNIPTREMAEAVITQARADAFDGAWFRDRKKAKPEPTVAELWEFYLPKTRDKNKSWRDDVTRARHLLRHLGECKAAALVENDIVVYRTARLKEKTPKKTAPKPATLNREVALLKRVLSYAFENRRLVRHPLKGLKMLHEDNVREVVVDGQSLELLLSKADEFLKPILLVAYDTGMRRQEVINLRWSQVDLVDGVIELYRGDTKGKKARKVPLADRTLEALRSVPTYEGCEHVFVNPRTLKPWYDAKKKWEKARADAALDEVWFHDMRRSFTTHSRKAGNPESVVMKITGHKTRSVFDRYNIVDDDDLRTAIERTEKYRSVRTILANKTDMSDAAENE